MNRKLLSFFNARIWKKSFRKRSESNSLRKSLCNLVTSQLLHELPTQKSFLSVTTTTEISLIAKHSSFVSIVRFLLWLHAKTVFFTTNQKGEEMNKSYIWQSSILTWHKTTEKFLLHKLLYLTDRYSFSKKLF